MRLATVFCRQLHTATKHHRAGIMFFLDNMRIEKYHNNNI